MWGSYVSLAFLFSARDFFVVAGLGAGLASSVEACSSRLRLAPPATASTAGPLPRPRDAAAPRIDVPASDALMGTGFGAAPPRPPRTTAGRGLEAGVSFCSDVLAAAAGGASTPSLVLS